MWGRPGGDKHTQEDGSELSWAQNGLSEIPRSGAEMEVGF